MRDTYIPLFASTLDSSLWSLDGDCLKVFLTLALKADPEGCVSAALDGLARAAALPIADVIRHVKRLEGPDEYSKDLTRQPANGGRRLERIAGGWRVINIEWYREEARRQAELSRKRRWWEEKGSGARRDARRTETETETRSPQKEIKSDPPLLPAVLRTIPEGYVPSEALLSSAEQAGCPRETFLAKLAELGDGPIGGNRGVLPHKLESYLLKCSGRWRTWGETEAAKAIAAAHQPRGATFRQGVAPLDPSAAQRAYVAKHGLDLPGILDELHRAGVVDALGAKGASDELTKRLTAAARKKGKPSAPVPT